MSFKCKNGPEHRHETREEARICWGLMAAPTPARVPVAGPVRPYEHPERSTGSQVHYVGILGGDTARARSMSKSECSTYIDRLKAGKESRVTEPTAAPRPTERVSKVPPELLKMVREGRYAVRADDAHPYVFIRISTGKGRSQYKDALKVQTQHAERLSEPKLVVWPSGKVSLYDYSIEDPLLMVIADQQGAARAYARELGRCARCGIELTDEESRRLGVGPECIKHWPHFRVLAAEEEEAKRS